MLFDINGNKIDWIPHPVEYETWKNQLKIAEIEAIFDELDSCVSEANVRTSSWIPGHNWTGTVYQPIYDACQDWETAAKFFGLILWEVMMKRDKAWCFGRYEKDGIQIKGMTYFRGSRPRPVVLTDAKARERTPT